MKKLKGMTICVLLLVFVLSACGCVTGLHGGITGAYFATVDEMIDYFKPSNPSIYDCLRIPLDERFVESGYMCYNMYDQNEINPELKNDTIISVYKLNVNGEEVYIAVFVRYDFLTIQEKDELGYEELSEPVSVFSPEMIFNRSGDRYNFPYADYKPEGFVKEITEEKVFTYEEFKEASLYFSITNGMDYFVGQVVIYDTRDVPQAEKDALALELMEILYNNYELAGEVAE